MDLLKNTPDLNDIAAWFNLTHKMSVSYIINHPELPWCWWILTPHNSITVKFILKSLRNKFTTVGQWDWYWVCKKPIVKKDIEENLNLPWDWHVLAFNTYLPYKYLAAQSKVNLFESQTPLYQGIQQIDEP